MTFDVDRLIRDYGDPWAEARACRASCALFDFSFIARGRMRGPLALETLGRLTRRPLADLAPGKIRYAVRETVKGHAAADLTIWRLEDGDFEVMSGRQQDIDDLVRLAPIGSATDLGHETAIAALQGPDALAVLSKFSDPGPLARLAYFANARIKIGTIDCLVGRLGYTGEPGFELIVPKTDFQSLWGQLAQHATPAGFTAADILRIEAGFVLFANEFQLPVTAREAGLAMFAGGHWIGGDAELALVAFRALSSAPPGLWRPPRTLERVSRPGDIAVTSACFSPLAEGILGLGYVRRADLEAGYAFTDPLGAFTCIKIVPRPYYDPGKRRPRTAWRA